MKCAICGKEIEKSMFMGTPICSEECFHVEFWNKIVDEKKEHVFIDGKSYVIADEQSQSFFRGFGGRKFTIKMLETGEIITTTNLWFQGDIPETHRELLPDTAVFVQNNS